MEAKIDAKKVAELVFPDYQDVCGLELETGITQTLFTVSGGPSIHTMSHKLLYPFDNDFDCGKVSFDISIRENKKGYGARAYSLHDIKLIGYMYSVIRTPGSPIFVHVGLMVNCVGGANRLYPRSQFMPDVVITKYDPRDRSGYATLCPEIIAGIAEGKREFN
jgi:hypothetical protein